MGFLGLQFICKLEDVVEENAKSLVIKLRLNVLDASVVDGCVRRKRKKNSEIIRLYIPTFLEQTLESKHCRSHIVAHINSAHERRARASG